SHEAVKRFIKAIDKGLLKVMSKMGISTYQSYCGAQIFEAVGLAEPFVDKYFSGTPTAVEGIGLRIGTPRSTAASSTRAASTPTGLAARRTCGRRIRSRSCSMRRAPTTS